MLAPIARFRIREDSMSPSFESGDYILVSGLPYIFGGPKKGDVIVFKHSGEYLVKRVARVTKRNTYFVVGDNKTDSIDSRRFGPIKSEQLIGKVVIRIKKT